MFARYRLLVVLVGAASALASGCLGRDLPIFDDGGPGGSGGTGGAGGGGVSCTNLVKDGDETDADCGGTCPACPPLGHCSVNADCSSDRCDGGVCATPCGLSDLVLYYPFESGLADATGNGHDGLATDVTSVPGKFGNGLSFNGSSSRVLGTGAGDIAGARTLCAWVLPEPAGGLGQPIFATGAAGSADFFSLQSDIPGGACSAAPADTIFQEHAGSPCVFAGNATVPNDQWTMVCFSNDGSGGGRFVVNDSVVSLGVGVYSAPIASLYVGGSAASSTSTQASFKGTIDEVTVWSRALDGAELLTLYGAGAGCVP